MSKTTNNVAFFTEWVDLDLPGCPHNLISPEILNEVFRVTAKTEKVRHMQHCCLSIAQICLFCKCLQLIMLFEPVHEKTNNLHRRKQNRRSASR